MIRRYWREIAVNDKLLEAARISSPFARSCVVEAGTRERWRGHYVSGDTAALQARAGSVISRKKSGDVSAVMLGSPRADPPGRIAAPVNPLPEPGKSESVTNRQSHSDQLRKRASSGLLHDVSAMMLGSPRADPQPRRDNLVGMSFDK